MIKDDSILHFAFSGCSLVAIDVGCLLLEEGVKLQGLQSMQFGEYAICFLFGFLLIMVAMLLLFSIGLPNENNDGKIHPDIHMSNKLSAYLWVLVYATLRLVWFVEVSMHVNFLTFCLFTSLWTVSFLTLCRILLSRAVSKIQDTLIMPKPTDFALV